jgi:PAS domain S-box-containing protein
LASDRPRASDSIEKDWLNRPVDLKEVLDLAADAILLLSEDQRIWFFNASAARLFGYTPEEAIGQPLDILIPERFARTHLAHVHAFEAGPEASRHMADRAPVVGRRKDGSEVILEISISRQRHAGVVTFAAIARDITDRLQAYQILEQRVEERTREIERRRQVAQGLEAVLAVLNSNRPLTEILAHIVERACQEFNTGAGAIFRLEASQQTLAIQQAQGLPADYIQHARLSLAADGLSQTATGRQPVFIADVAAALPALTASMTAVSWKASLAVARRYPAILAIPLFLHDEFYGEIVLYFQEGHAFSTEELGLALMIGNQTALALENARLHEQVQAIAALEERQKLARELHDSVTQVLYGIALSAQTAQTLLKQNPAKAADTLKYCLSLTETGLAEMRALIFELRPEALEIEGLIAAISRQAEAWQSRHGISISLALDAEPQAPMSVKETLYRLTQESLQNILRHAHARQVSVRLENREAEIFWEVKDDGVGFDQTASFPGHLGLRSMQERVEKAGGTFEIKSAPGEGTCVWACIPLLPERQSPPER